MKIQLAVTPEQHFAMWEAVTQYCDNQADPDELPAKAAAAQAIMLAAAIELRSALDAYYARAAEVRS